MQRSTINKLTDNNLDLIKTKDKLFSLFEGKDSDKDIASSTKIDIEIVEAFRAEHAAFKRAGNKVTASNSKTKGKDNA